MSDVRYALRSLRHAPRFTAVVLVTLALGIGANAAIFSIADAVLLKTIPVAEPEELYFLGHGTGDAPSLNSTYPLFARYRTLDDVFSGVTAYMVREFKVSTDVGLAPVAGQYVAGNYHDVLGVPMIVGRGFQDTTDRPQGRALAAVISDRFWTRSYGRDPNVLGKTLLVDGHEATIVGVTAAGFHGMRPGTQFDVTLPLAARALADPGFLDRHDTWTGLNIVARVRPDVGGGQALARVEAVFQQYMSEPEQAWTKRGGRVAEVFRAARLVPASRGTGGLRALYDWPLRILLGMVGLVLLIACANVAHLLLVRSSGRAREVAIRVSLGATRGRLAREFLTESLILALGGGALGLLFSVWLATAVVSLFGGGQLPVTLSIELDRRLLAFTTGLSLLTAALVGLVPALRASSPHVARVLRSGGSGWSTRRAGASTLLPIGQVALTIVLLSACGALVRSLLMLRGTEAGFDSRQLLLFYVTAPPDRGAVSAAEGLIEELRSLPGVITVSFSTASPLSTDEESRPIAVPGTDSGLPRPVLTNRVSPGYFAAFGVSLLRGRVFTPRDAAAAPRVAIVSESMARTFFGAVDPIGRTFVFAGEPQRPVTVVGVARDVRHQNLRTPPSPLIYLPLGQSDEPPFLLTAAIRTLQSPRSIERDARAAVAAYDRDLLVSYIRTMDEQVATSLVRERVMAWLSTGFGLLALLLACVGLYGVMAYNVAFRTREIGIRIALGAAPPAVLRRTLRDALLLCAIGLAAGLPAAIGIAPAIGAFVYGMSPRDPVTLAAATIVLLATAALAAYGPARRAARVDPVLALKAE